MNHTLDEATNVVEKTLSESKLLRTFCYPTHRRTPIAPLQFSEMLSTDPGYRFSIETGPFRRLDIDFRYSESRQSGSFCVTFRNLATEDEFLLNEWMKEKDIRAGADPWGLSSYSGAFQERVAEFVTFLENQLSTSELADILAGRTWIHIPYDWGAMK